MSASRQHGEPAAITDLDSRRQSGIQTDWLDEQIHNSDRLLDLLTSGELEEFLALWRTLSPPSLDVDLPDSHGRYLVYVACDTNHPEVIEAVLSARPQLAIRQGRDLLINNLVRLGYRQTLLRVLAASRETVGRDVLSPVSLGDTSPLFLAIIAHDWGMMDLLLHHGADPFQEMFFTVPGETRPEQIIYSLMSWVVSVVQIPAVIRRLLAGREDQINRHLNGRPMLIWAATAPVWDNVALLLELGADPNQVGDHLNRVLELALRANHKPTFELAIQYGSKPNHQNYNGQTGLHLAIYLRSLWAVRLWLTRYPLIGPETACVLDHPQLSETAYQPNLTDLRGQTPVHILLEIYGSLALPEIRHLLRYTDPNLPNYQGQTVLHLIVTAGLWEPLADILATLPLDIRAPDHDGQTPLSLSSTPEALWETAVRSYYYLLVGRPGVWALPWQQECSVARQGRGDCLETIRTQLQDPSLSTYPRRQGLDIRLDTDPQARYHSWTGEIYINYASLRLLRDRHPEGTPPYLPESITGFIRDSSINYHRGGIEMPRLWPEIIQATLDQGTYLYMMIGISITSTGHANALIYRVPENTLERFEPAGGSEYYLSHSYRQLDSRLKEIFTASLAKHGVPPPTYYAPPDYQSQFSFQSIDELEPRRSNDPLGYCGAWSAWYIDYRARYIHLDPVTFHQKLLLAVRRAGSGFKTVIRNYSRLIINISRQVHRQIDDVAFEEGWNKDLTVREYAMTALYGDLEPYEEDP